MLIEEKSLILKLFYKLYRILVKILQQREFLFLKIINTTTKKVKMYWNISIHKILDS